MEKGKIALIVTSVILSVGLIIAAVFIGLNWSKLKSAIVDKTQLYTYEQLEAAKKEGYDEAGLNKTAYEKQLKEFAGEVARLESEVNSLKKENAELIDRNSSLETKSIESNARANSLEEALQSQKREIILLKSANSSLKEHNDSLYKRAIKAEEELMGQSSCRANAYSEGQTAEFIKNIKLKNLEKPNNSCILLSFCENRFSYPDLYFEDVFGLDMGPIFVDVTKDFKLPTYNGVAPEGWSFVGWSVVPMSARDYEIKGDLFIKFKDGETIPAGTLPTPSGVGSPDYTLFAVFAENQS